MKKKKIKEKKRIGTSIHGQYKVVKQAKNLTCMQREKAPVAAYPNNFNLQHPNRPKAILHHTTSSHQETKREYSAFRIFFPNFV